MMRIGTAFAALVLVGIGAGYTYGVDAAFMAVGLALAASTWSMR